MLTHIRVSKLDSPFASFRNPNRPIAVPHGRGKTDFWLTGFTSPGSLGGQDTDLHLK